MSRVVPMSQALPMSRVRVNSSTDTSYQSRTYTSVIPTSQDGLFDISSNCPTDLKIVPFGQNASGLTFEFRVLGWQKDTSGLYVPLDLFEGTATLGTLTGTGTGIAATTIAAASNNVALPTGTINVASTTGFLSAGTLQINTSLGVQKISYTGKTSTAFLGCNLSDPTLNGTGTLSTGGAVSQTGYGTTGSLVTANDYFATTITESVGNAGVDCDVVSPGNNQLAHVLLDSKGSMFIEILFNRNSSATQCNALIGGL